MSYLLQRVRQDKMSIVKNGADQLLRVRQYKKSKELCRTVANSKTRQDTKSKVRNDADL